MPVKGQATPRRVTAKNLAEKKREVIAAIAEGHTIGDAADKVGVSRRAVYDWRQKDEKFALAFSDAYDVSTDKLRTFALDRVKNGINNPDDKYAPILLMFLLKQRDPSYRDNAKTELSVSPELAGSLTKLAKLAESK